MPVYTTSTHSKKIITIHLTFIRPILVRLLSCWDGLIPGQQNSHKSTAALHMSLFNDSTVCINLSYKSFSSLKWSLDFLYLVYLWTVTATSFSLQSLKNKGRFYSLKCSVIPKWLYSKWIYAYMIYVIFTTYSPPCLFSGAPTSSVNQPSGHQTLWELMDLLGYIRQASAFIIHRAVHPTPLDYLDTLL